MYRETRTNSGDGLTGEEFLQQHLERLRLGPVENGQRPFRGLAVLQKLVECHRLVEIDTVPGALNVLTPTSNYLTHDTLYKSGGRLRSDHANNE